MDLTPPIGHDHGVVRPVRVDPKGLTGPRPREAAGPEWRRSSHGRYVPSYVEQTPAQRIAEAGILVPKHGAVTGWAALAWMHAWWFSGLEFDAETFRPVPLAVSFHWIRPQSIVKLCEERLDPREIVVVDGLQITVPARSVCFEMRYAHGIDAAVTALDLAAFHDLVSVADGIDWAAAHPSYTGIEQCRQAGPLADENSWSPMEPVMRLEWEDQGFVRPLTNRPVFDLSGKHIGTPDLIDPVTGVAGEYNGSMHLEGTRRAADLRRDHIFREHGLEPVTMVGADCHDRGPFRARLRAAYARAERAPASDRRWTLERPSWWPATFTVAQRRALSEQQRATWLRYRAG